MKKKEKTRKDVMKSIESNLKEQEFKLEAFNLDAVEKLETAIAPGGFEFGCGCKGVFGAFCG